MLTGLSVTTAGAAALADPEVVLVHNTISGQIHFTNADLDPNAEVVPLLAQVGILNGRAQAWSTAPAGYWSDTWPAPDSVLGFPYQLSAESAAGGAPGVTYVVTAAVNLYPAPDYTASGAYYFQPAENVVLTPDTAATADLAECVGIVEIRWGLGADCSVLSEVHSGHITTTYSSSSFANTNHHYVIQRGSTSGEDTSETKTLYTTLGSDPTLDTITFETEIDLHPECNQIQHVCIDVAPYLGSGGTLFGTLTGPFDVVGETEQGSTFVHAFDGPATNQRYGYFAQSEMLPGSPEDWWQLPHLLPGSYKLFGQTIVRSGREANEIRTPRLGADFPIGPATVVAGATSDVQRAFGGASRFPFVMQPAHFHGTIELADPFVAGNGGSYSSLEALQFSTDPGVDTASPQYTRVYAQDSDNGGYGLSITSFPGAFDPQSGRLTSSYEQVLANTYDLPTPWYQNYLRLYLRDALHDRSGELYLNRDPAVHELAPGEDVTIDHRYCFNEVTLPYATASGLLFNPRAHVSGGYSGVDWEGTVTSYTTSGDFTGLPGTSDAAATGGLVHLLLPQGTFTITPGAAIVADSGSVSSATFESLSLTLGCGQKNDPGQGVSVSLDQLPPCATAAALAISGAVDSGSAEVDQIWYTVNDGDPVVLCAANCGQSPAIAATVVLTEECTSIIQVFAQVGSSIASVTALTIWDDPANGPSCDGKSCLPPAAACAEVTAEAVACNADDLGWTGTYEVTLDIHNPTTIPIVHVLLPDAHLSPHAVTLPSPLLPGESTSVTVTVSDAHPDSMLCVDVGLTDATSDQCCSQKLCVTLPDCCFTAQKLELECAPGAPDGTFTASLALVNHTGATIEHVFVFPPAGVEVEPGYVDVPPLVPGGSTFVGPLTFSGASPGKELCVMVGIHDEAMHECCSEEICFEVPEPCKEEPTKDPKEDGGGCSHAAAPPGGGSPGEALVLGLLGHFALRRRRRG